MIGAVSLLKHFSFHNIVVVGYCLEKLWNEFYAVKLKVCRDELVIGVEVCQIDELKVARGQT